MNTMHTHSDSLSADLLDLKHFHRIDLNLYPLFVAIYQQQSISQAAALLCISQSAASHALQRLRVILQDELFIRRGHKMLATAFAEQIYPQLLQALTQLQSVSMPEVQVDLQQISQLKIAMHDEVEPLILAKLIQHFYQINPKLQLHSIKLDRNKVYDEIQSQQIDFFIDIEQKMNSDILSQSLLEDQLMVCTQSSTMDRTTYLNAPHIGVSSRRTGTLIEDLYLEQLGYQRHILLRCQHYSTAMQVLMTQPKAMLTLPHSVAKHMAIAPDLKLWPSPISFPSMKISLYWSKSLHTQPRLSVLRKEIMSVFAK